MRDDERDQDPMWNRIVGDMRREPAVDPAARARVMDAVRALPVPYARTARWWRSGMTARTIAISPLQAVAAALVVAALGAGVAGWRLRGDGAATAPVVASREPAAASLTGGDSAAARPVQFVFVSSEARDVALVGDFNDWRLGATPMRRVSRDGLWSVVVPLAPGRHVYSFVVDGRTWVPDERAPLAPESEFGGENSVILVGAGAGGT
jgi:hypothetical protein